MYPSTLSLDTTMSIQLSPLCEAFIESMNTFQSEPFLNCFADDAIVEDEAKTHRGQTAIRAWIEGAFSAYQPVLSVETVVSNRQETVIIGPVSGTFPGSPITLCYHLAIENGKIQHLRCAAE